MTGTVEQDSKPDEDQESWALTFDHDACEWFTETPTEATCFVVSAFNYRAAQGKTRSRRRPCRSPWCARCGPFRLGGFLGEVWRRWREGPEVWHAEYPATDAVRNALKTQVSEAKRRGEPVGLLTVVRGSRVGTTVTRETLHVYGSRPLPTGGALTPWQRLTGLDAARHLRDVALALPGVVQKPRWSGAWAPAPDPARFWATVAEVLVTHFGDGPRGARKVREVGWWAAWLALVDGHAVGDLDGSPSPTCTFDAWTDYLLDAAHVVTSGQAASLPFRPMSSPVGQNGKDRCLANLPAVEQLSLETALVSAPEIGHTDPRTADVLPAVETSATEVEAKT